MNITNLFNSNLYSLNFLIRYKFKQLRFLTRKNSIQYEKRLAEIIQSIQTTGSYELTETELNYGARLAWRNSSKCIGRIQWSNLQVYLFCNSSLIFFYFKFLLKGF